jgi:hypothetical protein
MGLAKLTIFIYNFHTEHKTFGYRKLSAEQEAPSIVNMLLALVFLSTIFSTKVFSCLSFDLFELV